MKTNNFLRMNVRFFILILFVATIFVSACSGSGSSKEKKVDTDTVAYAEIKFDTTVYNFGKILEGEQVTYKFDFTNIGKKSLVIEKVETSCGCTVPEYDKKPVEPGQRGYVRVKFDSSNKEGTVYKTVKITSNCKERVVELVITGQIAE